MPPRPIAVLGTDTGVGKTALAAGLCGALNSRGWRVAAIKPLATGVPSGEAGEDAELLAEATGADPHGCVLETFELPRSPLAAARAEGRMIDVDGLAARVLARLAWCDALIVEGVGGVLVPLAPGRTVRDLVRRLDAPVLLAARPGLGTLNHTAMSVEACRIAGLEVIGVVIVDATGDADSQFVEENRALIEEQCAVRVLGVLPRLADPTVQALTGAVLHRADLLPVEAELRRDPAAAAAEIVALDRAHAWHPFTQATEWNAEEPVVIAGGDGVRLRDLQGRTYLDGVSSLWANLHGHAHPGIDRAVREQLGRIAHSTFLGLTHEPGARLCAELAAVAPAGLSRVFLSESGASAVEVALRMALLAQRYRGAPDRVRLLSLAEAYHGDTAGAVSVGRSEPFHRGLEPLLVEAVRVAPPQLIRVRDGVDHETAEARSLAELAAALDEHGDTLAAAIVEPRVQGAAGIWPHSDRWLREAARMVRASDALLICDEVATGFGRTGDLWASAGAGIAPDILTLGKGLSGGYLPISATLCPEGLYQLFAGAYDEHRTLYYGHTFTANPLACAAARASLAAMAAESTVQRARAAADRLGTALGSVTQLPGVAEVRRRGLITGIELTQGGLGEPFPPAWRMGRRVCLAARRRGVIVRPLGDVIVLNPAPVISDVDCDQLVSVVADSITEVIGSLAGTTAARV